MHLRSQKPKLLYMPYNLPVIINDRRVTVLQLKENQNSTASVDASSDEYIIPKAMGQARIQLFRVQFDTLLTTEVIGSKDIPFFIEDVAISFKKESDRFEITISAFTGNTQKVPFTSCTLEQVELSVQNQELVLAISSDFVLSPDGFKKTPVIINLIIQEKQYSAQLIFCITEPADIAEFIFDFGSEASQYKMVLGNQLAHEIPIPNIFQHVGATFNIDNSKIYEQQDKSNNEVFVSKFYMKKKLTGNAQSLDIQEDNVILKILTTEEEAIIDNDFKNNYQQLPNLKISGVLNPFEFTLNDINQHLTPHFADNITAILLNHFYKSFYKILTNIRGENCNKYFIKIRLLVPNIYTTQRISYIINAAGNYLKNQCNTDNKIIAIEFSVVSESDASFLGWYDIQRYKGNDILEIDANYLIIDIGKGTTDISVMHKFNSNNLQSRCRSGFAGAGNLITFAILQNLATIICYRIDKVNYRRNVTEWIGSLTNDTNKAGVMKAIENIKKNYCEVPISEDEFLKNLYCCMKSDPSLETIDENQLVKDLENLLKSPEQFASIFTSSKIKLYNLYPADYYGIIDNACDMLVNKIEKSLSIIMIQQWHISGYLLTGRGMLFKLLKDKLVVCLKKKTPKAKSLALEDDSLKRVCVNVTSTPYYYNNESTGALYSASQKNSELNNGNGETNEFIFKGLKLVKPPKTSFFRWLLSFIGFRLPQVKAQTALTNGNASFILERFEHDDAYCIVNYTRAGYIQRFFTPDNKLIRCNLIGGTIVEENDDNKKKFVFWTLFPNLAIKKEDILANTSVMEQKLDPAKHN